MKTMKMRCLWPSLNVLFSFAAALALSALIHSGPASAEDPPRPTQRLVSAFPVSAAPAQYELVQQVLDFAPGAATRLHHHGGRAFVTVLEGQVARREGDFEAVFSRGQTFIEEAGKFHTVSNNGNVRARVFASFLISPGQPQTINHPSSPAPALLPTVAFLGRTKLGTQPSEFTLLQVVLDFGPGGYLPWHNHGGPGLIMVIEGELAFRTDSGELRRRPGETFRDVEPHDMRNVVSGASASVATFLLERGQPGTTFLDTVAAQPATSIRAPATGDAGLAMP